MSSADPVKLPLQLQDVAPGRGVVWLRKGFQLFMRRPLAFTLLFSVYLMAAMLLVVLPFVGSVLVVMSLPLLSLGFMVASRSALAGGPVHPRQLIEPLMASDAARRKTLLKLCVLYGLATIVIFLICDWIDDGSFERLQTAVARGDDGEQLDPLLTDPRLATSMWLRLALTALLSVPFWHAPALVHWAGQGMAQSLFTSTLAVWRCKGAFLTAMASGTGLVAFFGVVITLVFTLLGLPQLIPTAALPAALLFSTVFYVSLYFTFADSFLAEPAPAPQPSRNGH